MPQSPVNNNGGDCFDPVRLRLIEAMERRAESHVGDARRVLDERVQALRDSYEADRMNEGERGGSNARSNETPRPPRSALAELVDHLSRKASADSSPTPGQPHAPAARTEVKALGFFRDVWSRLSAQKRLTQSLATLPENAGPLNSHQLVHRSLTLMRDLSPEYLNRFMQYADTLLWIEQLNARVASTGSTSSKKNYTPAATIITPAPAPRGHG